MAKKSKIDNLTANINNQADNNSTNLIDLFVRAWARPEVPVAIVGNPGSGKTAQVEAFCKAYGLPLVKVLASSMDETDVAGILVYDKDKDAAILKRNELFLRLMNGGVLFLDELNTARKEVADTLLTLIQSRELPGGYKLPKNVLIIACMNDAKQCDNYELTHAMKNRFMWIKKVSRAKEWWSFMLDDNNRLGDNKKELEKPKSISEFLEWFRKPENDKDKKAVIDLAIKKGLEVASDEQIEQSDYTHTSNRSLTNLVYWTKDAQDMIFWAPSFIGDSDASILKAVSTTALKNIANSVFDDGLQQDNGSEPELLHIQMRTGTLTEVKEAVKRA